MPLLCYRNLSVSYGGPRLLDNVGITIEKKERICLLGRNGEGKSTLLRILAGQISPDKGEFERMPDLRVAKLDQEIPQGVEGTIFDVVARGLGKSADLLCAYNRAAKELADHPEDEEKSKLVDRLQEELDQSDGWSLDHRVASVIDRVGLSPDEPFDIQSGGNKSRTMLAQALVGEPHLLILDEPTNHLDFAGIRWLEDFILRADLAVVFVSHDRAFLRRVSTRILELDRGKLTSWTCGYEKFLQRKEEVLAAEEKNNAVFDKKLAEEEVWIRKGIQARRTRNEGRVRALFKLREERAVRRELQGKANLRSNQGQTSGRKVILVKDLTYTWDTEPIVAGFSTTIWRGDKIGVVGLNGSGKSTFLQLLLKRLEPQRGEVEHGTKLEIAFFDQLKSQIKDDWSVAENVAPNGDFVILNGERKHILSYLRDFLFLPETARAPARMLSGGERARLLLAKLFLQPANLLVMDEPTNDLDVETIELLEERLLEYSGTLLLVSHDRDFLDHVVTGTLALDGKGRVEEYAGASTEWMDRMIAPTAPKAKAQAGAQQEGEKASPPKRKLLNKEREALKTLPAEIERMEAERDRITSAMQDPNYYRDPKSDPQKDQRELEKLEIDILAAYEQWDELEALSSAS
jgi:ATP-binding cassette subfamily F protein uup